MTVTSRAISVGNAALILALYLVFSPFILAGIAVHLAYEFVLVGWESVERVL